MQLRGADEAIGSLFSCVDLEGRVPSGRPLWQIRRVVSGALVGCGADFDELYTDFGRPSIPPERLIRVGLPQIPCSIRSERQQMTCGPLFHRFAGLGIDDPVWVPTVFDPGTATGC